MKSINISITGNLDELYMRVDNRFIERVTKFEFYSLDAYEQIKNIWPCLHGQQKII